MLTALLGAIIALLFWVGMNVSEIRKILLHEARRKQGNADFHLPPYFVFSENDMITAEQRFREAQIKYVTLFSDDKAPIEHKWKAETERDREKELHEFMVRGNIRAAQGQDPVTVREEFDRLYWSDKHLDRYLSKIRESKQK